MHPRQKTLLNRIKSEALDRNAWLNSVVQAVVNKQLPEFTDEDERLLSFRLAESFKDLDDFLEWSKLNFDEEKEHALTIEIRGTDDSKLKTNVILTQKQTEETEKVEKEIKKLLKKTKYPVNRAALINLLKKNLEDDKD